VLANLLDPLMIYYLSGKLIALNDGTMPILTYIQDSVTAVSMSACYYAETSLTNSNKIIINK
jgi:hypothetical protein